MAYVLKADGTAWEQKPRNEVAFTPPEIQVLVHGDIEVIKLPWHGLMFVNEEGVLLGLPWNVKASGVAEQRIVGDVLLGESDEFE